MDTLDELDFDVLRELTVGSGAYLRSDRVSLEGMARAVGVHRSTVADRIAKWTRLGFLGDWTIDVDPAALGLVGAHTHFDSKAEPRERALQLAALVEGVEGVLAFDQGWVGVIFMADSPDALARTERLLARILEAERSSRIVDTAVDYPESLPIRLSPIDAKLLTVLMRDSRQTPAGVAKRAHVTVRTVERRLGRLRKAGVYYVRPVFHYARVPGVSFGLLCFEYSKGARGAALRQILRMVTNQVGRQVEAPTRGALVIYGSARELDDSARAVASIPGVHHVILRVLVGEVESPGFAPWLLERIDRRSRVSKVASAK
jgi:DNA-binding Lrp family transcriptional regulator